MQQSDSNTVAQGELEYIKEFYPHLLEEYHRKTTPFYYEPGVLYHPITNGFGCSSEGSKEPFQIINGSYCRDGDINITMLCKSNNPNKRGKYGLLFSEAYKKFKRLDESITPIGKTIPNNKSKLYMTVNGIEYSIYQAYWRNYDKGTLGGRVIIKCLNTTITSWGGAQLRPYFELYSNFGSIWHLKTVTGYDSVAREQYNTKFNVSVRKFKELVFGDSNVKFKCNLFGHL